MLFVNRGFTGIKLTFCFFEIVLLDFVYLFLVKYNSSAFVAFKVTLIPDGIFHWQPVLGRVSPVDTADSTRKGIATTWLQLPCSRAVHAQQADTISPPGFSGRSFRAIAQTWYGLMFNRWDGNTSRYTNLYYANQSKILLVQRHNYL